MKRPHKSSARRGTALVLALILTLVIVGLVAVIAWMAGVQSQSTANLSKVDQAFFAAETGVERVAWYCKQKSMSSITSPISGTVNGYAYSTSWTTNADSTVSVTSVGSLGSVSSTMSVLVTPPASNPPVLAAGNGFDNKNIDIYGDVMTGTNYNNGGNGSLTGNLTYYGTATNPINITGTVTPGTGSFPSIDMTAVGTTLIATAQATYSGAQTNKTFDFTALSGTNKVIYVNGNVTNPTFVGTGTLYVNGTVSVGGFGTAANPVNIVASGDITTSNNIAMYGSIFTAGDWNRGKFTLTGMVYATGQVQNSNFAQSTLTQSTVPWFDPRVVSGAATITTFTKFAGTGI